MLRFIYGGRGHSFIEYMLLFSLVMLMGVAVFTVVSGNSGTF